MTGFGRAAGANELYDLQAELSSLNNRYLDLNLKVPRVLNYYQHPLRDLLKKSVQRGKLNLFLSVRKTDQTEAELPVDQGLARSVVRAAEELSRELGIENNLGVREVLAVDGVLGAREDNGENPELWNLCLKVLESVLEEFHATRAREGEAMAEDILGRLTTIEEGLQRVETAWHGTREARRGQLKERLLRLIEEEQVKAERFEMEIALLLDRQDISEEITRFQSHISFFRETVSRGGSVGSKLNFIVQEMLREANTISSKSPDTVMTHEVVAIKEEIERIREQVQNIE